MMRGGPLLPQHSCGVHIRRQGLCQNRIKHGQGPEQVYPRRRCGSGVVFVEGRQCDTWESRRWGCAIAGANAHCSIRAEMGSISGDLLTIPSITSTEDEIDVL